MPPSHDTVDEQARIASLQRLLPAGGRALEVGSRDGYITRLIAGRYTNLVALDLERPSLDLQGVTCVAGDVRSLDWPDDSFDVVLCSEVLEHLPAEDLQRACNELVRVCRRHLLIGIPFEQDLRVARTRCRACGTINPPYGHINRFTASRLTALFDPMRPVHLEKIGRTREGTNAVSDLLMRMAGYPWGTYDQDEPCIGCGNAVGPRPPLRLPGKILSTIAARLDRLLKIGAAERAKWLHVLFEKPGDRERLSPAP